MRMTHRARGKPLLLKTGHYKSCSPTLQHLTKDFHTHHWQVYAPDTICKCPIKKQKSPGKRENGNSTAEKLSRADN